MRQLPRRPHPHDGHQIVLTRHPPGILDTRRRIPPTVTRRHPLSTDADRLLAAGIPLRIGERDVRVRFSMRSMKALEERYGSLAAVNEHVQGLLADAEDKPFSTLLPLVAAGLLHEGLTEDGLGDAMVPSRYFELRGVLVDAINESFPDVEGKAPEGDQRPAPADAGATGTTSPPSDLPAATTSSGA